MHVLRNLFFDLFLILCLRKEDSKTVEDSGPTPKKVGNFLRPFRSYIVQMNRKFIHPML